MFFPERYPSGDWDIAGFPVQPTDHWFETKDGVRLHAWFFASSDPGAPLMIWFHGNAGNLSHRGEVAAQIAKRGVSVFVFDWRGFGRSEGLATESSLYRDSTAAYEYAVSTFKPSVIAAYGESLGGPYAAYVARNHKVQSVVIENSFPSLKDLANTLYAPIPLGWTAPRAMATTRWLNEAGVPVLVMHGKRDGVIPFRLGQALYDGLRVPKTMLVSETAGHSEIPSVEGESYYGAVTGFIKKKGL